MATIKAIESRSIHQIQSGQVIVDLYSVVKELVENSLDAGATSIEVRFKNHGLDSIEVQDNGKGIPPEDFETIALKHYTSKLSSYEDLNSLETFGFRGEAISSLCALSQFSIITARPEDGAVGKKLDFDVSGKLNSTSVVAAQKGTTVAVENLFNNLPVRRKELEKNIKREYTKVINHLHAYACISVGVRFAVSSQIPKSKKVAVFSTKSNTTTKENITNVFGAKMLLSITKLDLHLEMEPSRGPSTQSARNWATQAIDSSKEVHIQGHISKPVFGEGRQTPDRQMFFVNSRPCGLPQVSKAFNAVYKSFNVSQSPFIFANLVMDTNAYDVNVSPDKRTIMLHDQTALLESLQKALTELFEQTDHTVPHSQLPNRKLPDYKPLSVQPRISSTGDPSPSIEVDADNAREHIDEDSDSGSASEKRIHDESSVVRTSLIRDWVGRDTKLRNEKPIAALRDQPLSGDSEKLIRYMPTTSTVQSVEVESGTEDWTAEGKGNIMPASGDTKDEMIAPSAYADHFPDAMGSPYDDLFSQRPDTLPRPVKDFNTLMDGGQDRRSPTAQPNHPSESEEEPGQDDARKVRSEVSTIAPSSRKATPGPIQNAFDRMRPKRTPLQTADITIGDTTTTTVIGSSPPSKRRRIHQPVNSQAIAHFGGSPILARGLRNFAAPGSQLQLDSSEDRVNQLSAANSIDHESVEASGERQNLVEHRTFRAPDRTLLKSRSAISSDAPTSDALEAVNLVPIDDDEYDEDYVDEHEKKMREDEKVACLIHEAELAAAQPSEDNLRRASQALKNGGNRKESTLQLAKYVSTSADKISTGFDLLQTGRGKNSYGTNASGGDTVVKNEIDDDNAEARLSLTVSKADFNGMTIIGQFNLGFILAVRPGVQNEGEDELFIIDQHAADEKYNYERLQRSVTLQNQRLVRPKLLDLNAVEEEIVLNNTDALQANGFEIETTSYVTDEESSERRCHLITLPVSGEKTFELSDLEELLHLLSEAPAGSSEIPRPKKVQKILAMRACRSSIMVGKTLTSKQMQKVVRHMGEMNLPWNCPHGRPTVRHLASFGAWVGWQEGDVVDPGDDSVSAAVGGSKTDWKAWLES